MSLSRPLAAAGRLLASRLARVPLGLQPLHNSATAGSPLALPGALQQQQGSSRQGQSSSSSSSSGNAGGGSTWARLWPLGAAGVPLLALGLYGGNLKWQADRWTQADTYSPIAPSYTPEGLKAAIAHNEWEGRKQDTWFYEGSTFIVSLIKKVTSEYVFVYKSLKTNKGLTTACGTLLPDDQQPFYRTFLAAAADGDGEGGTAPEDRARYLQAFELLKSCRREELRALRREQEQLSALVPPPPNLEAWEVTASALANAALNAFADRAYTCLSALEREHRDLSAELDRITSTSISSSLSEEALAASRARQRDIKLARNQAMLAAYRKQQEVLDSILGPLFVPGPTVPKRAFQAVMERNRALLQSVQRQHEGLSVVLADLPAPRSSNNNSKNAQFREGLEDSMSGSRWVARWSWIELVIALWDYATRFWWRPIDEWAYTALVARTAATIRALEREREQLLASE